MSLAGPPPELRSLGGEYEFLRELGRGGVAAVYLARHRESGKLVAVKAVGGAHLGDEEVIRRFAREAALVERLDHPNIVRTHSVARLGDRAVAIVMEYVDGATLRQALGGAAPFDFDRATSVLCDVAEALRYAHRHGIVHRDVKPENIFLEDATACALLSDFGTARRVEVDSGLTMAGASIGTPAYMAPEQIDGGVVDARSDIYSLGLVGWEMLAGRRAWDDENVYGILYKQKHEELPSLAVLRPDIPARLLFAIEGAVRKRREERWGDMDQFLTQLRRGGAVAPPAPKPGEEDAKREALPTVRLQRDPARGGPPPTEAPPRDPFVREPPLKRLASLDLPDDFGDSYGERYPELPSTGWRLAKYVVVLAAIVGVVGFALINPGPLRRLTTAAGGIIGSGASADAPRLDSAPPPESAATGTRAVRDSAPDDTLAIASAGMPPDTAAVDSVPRSDTAARSASIPLDSLTTAATPREPAPIGPPPRTRADSLRRCNSPNSSDQRACLSAWVAEDDVGINRVYRELVGEYYRQAAADSSSAPPESVRLLAAEQRGWLASRALDCERRYEARPGALWAPRRAGCMRRLSEERREELGARLSRLRS
ncbi:MAG: protein kinase domain-containing protein [Gemmatimonadaceae bacterium]